MKTIYTDFSQLPIMLNANELAQVLRISRANAYVLMNSQSIKTHRIGKRMLVAKSELIRYIEENANDSCENANDSCEKVDTAVRLC